MRKVACSIVLALALACMACGTSPIKKRAVDNLEKTHGMIFPEYIRLVEAHKYDADPVKDKKEKDDRKKLVESAQHIVQGLKEDVSED